MSDLEGGWSFAGGPLILLNHICRHLVVLLSVKEWNFEMRQVSDNAVEKDKFKGAENLPL